MDIQIVVGGYWLASIARAGELAYSHGADGGCLEASWKMDLPLTSSHPALRRGKTVDIKAGAETLWSGILSEPDADDDWSFTARGFSSLGRVDYLCLDSGGNTTSTPDTAIDQAITDGIGWTRPASLSSTAFASGGATSELNYVGELLDAWATSVSKRWGVNVDRQVYAATDPTTPTYHLTPGAGRFGLADDNYASDLYLRYLKSGAGYSTAHVWDDDACTRWGRRAYPVDLTSRGLLTQAQAEAIGNGLLAKGQAKMGYTNGLEVTKYQLTTPGGIPACLALVKGQQLVRQFGLLNDQGQPTNYVDWVIGETHYEAGSETIGLTPVGLVPTNFADIIAETEGRAA